MSRLNNPPKYDQESKKRARYAYNLADLLWRKAVQNLAPEIQELLNSYARIQEMVALVAPEDLEQADYTFEHIAKIVDEAEDLLIGKPQEASQPTGVNWTTSRLLQTKIRINMLRSKKHKALEALEIAKFHWRYSRRSMGHFWFHLNHIPRMFIKIAIREAWEAIKAVFRLFSKPL